MENIKLWWRRANQNSCSFLNQEALKRKQEICWNKAQVKARVSFPPSVISFKEAWWHFYHNTWLISWLIAWNCCLPALSAGQRTRGERSEDHTKIEQRGYIVISTVYACLKSKWQTLRSLHGGLECVASFAWHLWKPVWWHKAIDCINFKSERGPEK